MTDNKKSALEQLKRLEEWARQNRLKDPDYQEPESPNRRALISLSIFELAERADSIESRLEALEAQRETDLKMVYDVVEAKIARLYGVAALDRETEAALGRLAMANFMPIEANDSRTIELPEEVYEALDTVGLYRLADYSGAIVSDKYLADFRDRIRAETNDSRTTEQTNAILELAEKVEQLEASVPRVEGDNLMITAKPYGEAVGIYIGDRGLECQKTNNSRTIELPDDAFQHLVEVYQGAGATYQDDTPIVECESVTFIRQKKESK